MSTDNKLTVERNGVSVALQEQVFGKKSKDRAGVKFYAPEFTMQNFVELGIPFVGLDEVVTAVNKNLRRYGADIMVEFLDSQEYKDTGQISFEWLRNEWQNFTAGIQKLSDLEEQIDELVALQQSYVLDEDYGATIDGNEGSPLTDKANELQTLAKEVAIKIRPLRIKKKEIEAKYAERAAKRKAKEDKEAAATAS